MLKPREDYLDWETTWMAMAELIALRSKDPNTRCGAVLIDSDNHVIGMGYNGFPRKINSKLLPWDREGDYQDQKYPYVMHAELNGILFGNSIRIPGSKLFCSLFPCSSCCKAIIQSQISEVIYLSDKYHDTPDVEVSRKLFDMADIKTRQFIPKQDQVIINLKVEK